MDVQSLIDEGYLIIPVKKSKAPALDKKSKYFTEQMPPNQMGSFWGVAVRGGGYSDGAECLDFDDHDGKHNIKEVYEKFTHHEFIKHLISCNKLYIQQTKSGGYHCIYRYEAAKYEGSKVVSRWVDKEVMIETRGHGGYFIVPPTPGYTPMVNSLEELDKIEADERQLILEIAQDFNQYVGEKGTEEVVGKTEETDPVSIFNINKVAYAKKLLEDKGWQKVDAEDGVEKWTRPGKDEGVSATWGWRQNALYVFSSNVEDFVQGCYYTPFQILIKYRFKGNYQDALKWLIYKDKKVKLPYVRIGTDYFKIIRKADRYDVMRPELKPWKKDEIKQDHGKQVLYDLPKFDDFVIEPDNFDYKPVVRNCYNLYSEFSFSPEQGEWKWTKILLEHVFGDQYELGLKYLQTMYLHPKQHLPILALISRKRSTGKTTFINWMSMLFGDNMTIISPEDITNQFNFSYATKNVICIEETTIEKQATTEKLKAISTGKHINVNQKHISHYKLPLFAKIIITSNNEDRFIKIDRDEIRYFVRKLGEPKNQNAQIEEDLVAEIPAFLHYLTTLPDIDFTKSRMIFTPAELRNEFLENAMEESKPGLAKDLKERIVDLFYNSDFNEFEATPIDIKLKWFERDNNISLSYIRKVLKEDFKMEPSSKSKSYYRFGYQAEPSKGRPYKFLRMEYLGEELEKDDDVVPF